jgi:hypothetical protein
MVAEARAERNDHADNREDARRPKTVREKMGDAITDSLLLLCRATCDEELPRLYQEWAAHTRGVSEIWVMQQAAVEASCAVLSVPAFEVTPAQVMALKNFRLADSTYFDIGSGLLPFSITPSDATSSQARSMLVADQIHRPTLSTLVSIRRAVPLAPVKWHASVTLVVTSPKTGPKLRSTRGLLGALMGNAHPVVLAYGRFLQLYA